MDKQELQSNGTKNVINVEKPARTVFCHFSFKRPKGKDYGIFSVAFYNDFNGKQFIVSKTRKYDLWENQQFITAIQSYEHALLTIHELQGIMKSSNINQVMLITDNGILAKWIEDPKKNKIYAPYMERAVKPYRTGSFKEIVIGVGMCLPRKSEKSYKFCKEENVSNEYTPTKKESENEVNGGGYRLEISEYKSALEILAEDIKIPEIIGMNPIKIEE